MIYVLIVAVIAFALGVFLFLVARSRLKSVTSTPMVRASQVAALAEMGSDRCELTGVARAGERGVLTAPVSGVPSVWHRVRVEASYWTQDSEGEPRREVESVMDETSSAPIVLEEEDGVVVVDVVEAEVDGATVTSSDMAVGELSALGVNAANLSFNNEDNVEYHRTEWVIPDGAKLFVSGKPVAVLDQIGIGRPDKGKLLVSTRSEAELISAAQSQRKVGLTIMGLALVAMIVGVLL